jgi:hypothetical protein
MVEAFVSLVSDFFSLVHQDLRPQRQQRQQ